MCPVWWSGIVTLWYHVAPGILVNIGSDRGLLPGGIDSLRKLTLIHHHLAAQKYVFSIFRYKFKSLIWECAKENVVHKMAAIVQAYLYYNWHHCLVDNRTPQFYKSHGVFQIADHVTYIKTKGWAQENALHLLTSLTVTDGKLATDYMMLWKLFAIKIAMCTIDPLRQHPSSQGQVVWNCRLAESARNKWGNLSGILPEII